jgi:hypothetical protein
VPECLDNGDFVRGHFQLAEKGELREVFDDLPFADALAVWALKCDRLRERDGRSRPLKSFRNEDLRRQVRHGRVCASNECGDQDVLGNTKGLEGLAACAVALRLDARSESYL